MAEDYSVRVNVDVNSKELDSLNSVLKSIDSKKINVGIDTSAAHKKINELENRIKKLNNVKLNIGSNVGNIQNKISKATNNIAKNSGVGQIDTSGAKQAAAVAKQASAEIKQANASLMASINSVDKVSKLEAKFSGISVQSKEAAASIKTLKKAQTELNTAASAYKNDASAENRSKLVSAEQQYSQALRETTAQVNANVNAERMRTQEINNLNFELEKQKAVLRSDKWLKENSKAAETYGASIASIRTQMEKCGDTNTLKNLQKQLDVVHLTAAKTNDVGLTFGDKLKMQFGRLGAYFGASGVIMTAIQAGRAMFDNVKEVDTAMTELKRVTDLSATQYSDLYGELTVSAREYGTTLKDIINATADWSRAGFDANTAKGLAEVTTMYQHIADVDYDTAFQNLETAYKGFEDQLKQDFGGDTVAAVGYIGDILNELDNNFAVTADGVGQAIKRSASALSIAGNSIQETAGMVTGITEVTQDPEKAGNALKVLSMRLRGMKGELEDLGEDTDETVENLSKMQGQVLNLTHGHVNIFDDTGEFKSTYEIMQGIAEIYDELSSTEQADLLETIAGKHRANDVAALIKNWDQVASATEHATEATGSAAREHEKYLDSIEGRMNALTSVWETLSNTVLSSDLIKSAISALSGLLDILEKIISTIGGFGTAGAIGAFFLGFKKRNGITNVFKTLVSDVVNAESALGKLKAGLNGVSEAQSKFFFNSKGKINWGNLATGVLAVVALVGTAVSAYHDHMEKIRQANQETIDDSNKFLNSYNSFEQVYLKYADKTVLTADEENELKTAIDGTIDALGDKSSALRDAAGASSEYSSNLKEIAKAELVEAQRSANKAKQAAKENLKNEAGEYQFFSDKVSAADFKLPKSTTDEYKAIKDIIEDPSFRKYVNSSSVGWNQGIEKQSWFRFNKDTDLDGLVEQYNYALEIQNRLSDEAARTGNDELLNSATYKTVSESVDKMSSSMSEFVQQTYNAEKAGYQLENGIASTDEEFYKMRESILSAASDSLEVRSALGDVMNKEYADTFDLSSVEAKMNYIKSVTKDIADIGGNDENTFKTLLDLKTKVNDGDCSVGDYISQVQEANDAINSIEDEKTKEFLRVQLGIELDSDGNIKDDIKKSRDKLINDLKSSGVTEDVAKSFTDSLSKEELVVAQDLLVKGDLDLKNLNSKKLREKIAKIAEHNKALKFSVDIETETENLEKLNTAVSESLSGTGLSTESLTKVESMFKGMEGYDPSKLFERTANGVRLNTDELRKMNNEYAKTNVDGLNNKLNALAEEYNKTRSELSDLTYGTDEYNKKASELSAIEKQINETEQLTAQYKGLASAYNQWQQAEAAGSQRDMYESIITGFKNVEDELSRGWVDDGTIEFIELLSGQDLSSGNIDKIRGAWEGLGKTIEGTTYSVKDFFTTTEDGNSTSDGVYNFLEAVDQKFQNSDIIQKDENGNVIGFDFKVAGGDKAIADALGISEELVQIMVRAADDAGFVVSMDGTYQNLDTLKEKAQSAANTLKEMFKGTDNEITTEFNLQTNDENSIMEQYKSALDIWNKFKENKNADGTINMNVEGAEEAFTLVSTLQSMVDKLSEPTYMNISASEVDKNLQEPLNKLQQFEKLTQEEHQINLKGGDTSEIEKSKSEILNYFEDLKKNQPEIAAKLGVDKLSKEELEQKLNDGTLEVDAALNLQVEMNDTLRDQVNVALYSAGIIDKEELEKRVNVDVYAESVDTSDVENKTEEAVENSGDGEQSTETTADVDVKAGKVDTSDVKDKTEEAINSENSEDSTVEKSVDLEVSVDEYKEIIDDLNNANKDIEINVKVNGLDDVEKLEKSIDISAKVDGSVQDLTDYAEAAKQLKDVDDNTVKTISANLYGNLDKNKNIDSLQKFIDGAKELDGTDSSFVTVTANFSGNLNENKKSIENLSKFAEGAKALQGAPSSSVTIEANLKSEGIGNDFLKSSNSTLDNLSKFADSAKNLQGVGDASVSITANLDSNVGNEFLKSSNSTLDNLDKFTESAKNLQGVGDASVTITANLEGSGVGDNFFTGGNSTLDNLEKFAESAKSLDGVNDANVSITANLNSNIGNDLFSDSNSTLDNLQKFAEGAKSLEGVGNVQASITANLSGQGVGDNFFGNNSTLDNLEKFAEGAKKLDGVGDVSVSVSANINGDGVGDNFFGNNSTLDNLDKFTESAKNLQGVDDVDVSIKAGLDGQGVGNNLFGDNSTLDNLDKFADAAKKLNDVDDVDISAVVKLDVTDVDSDKVDKVTKFAEAAEKLQDVKSREVNVKANLEGSINKDNADNLEKFAEGAKKLQGVGDASVEINANLKGSGLENNLFGFGNNSTVDNLEKFAEGAKKLQGVGDVSSTVTANFNSSGLSNGLFGNSSLDNIDKFADGAEKMKNVGDASATITADLNGNIGNGLFGFGGNSKLDNLDKFADGAKKMQGVGDVSATVTANLNGNIGNDLFSGSNSKINNLAEFADGAKKLDGIGDKTVTLTANLNGNIGASGDAINNLPSFASTAKNLQDVSSKDVSITANVGGNISSENVTTLSQFGAAVSSLPPSATVSVSVSADTEAISNITTTLQNLSNSGVMRNYVATISANVSVTPVPVNTDLGSIFTGTGKADMSAVTKDMGSDFTGSGKVDMSASSKNMGDDFYGSGTVNITVNKKIKTDDSDGPGGVDGTAHVNGTANKAFAQGSWGTKEDGVALGGELGTELLVRNGRWYTIGENGAEFFGYKKDDIIFNADQTRELFEKGKITHGNGRGKALASGTAFSPGSTGSGGWGRPNTGSYHGSSSSSSGSSSSSSSSSSDKEEDKFEETLDWIETKIDRIERAISRLEKTASSTYKTWTKRNNALNDQISKTREEIDIQQRAYDRYIAQANKVGLAESYASKVRDGTIDIETITDEDLNDKISEYKEW